jgi:hypothetical protein
MTKIIYCVIVLFSNEKKTLYYKAMESMYEKHLSWWKLPVSEIAKVVNMKYINDQNTLQLWKNMGDGMRQFLQNNKNVLPAHDVKPYIVSLWNVLKGGQDVVSSQLKDIKIDFSSLSPRPFIIIRQITTMLLNAHLVARLIIMKPRKNLDEYTKYKRLKSALNELGTFSSFLWKFAENWNGEKLIGEKKIIDEADETHTPIKLNMPQRYRINYFNSDEGKKIRLPKHDHKLLHNQNPTKCVICTVKTTCACVICKIYLCRLVRKGKEHHAGTNSINIV